MPALISSQHEKRHGPWPAILSTTSGQQKRYQQKIFCAEIGRLAVRSLYAELTLYPKPGLVSLVDNGSHDDMTASTFMRSLFSLRHYFIDITAAGMANAPFATLKRLGIEAEQRMLIATEGINTHRGAIFCVGLLCAAIGYCEAQGITLTSSAIRAALISQWGSALAEHMQSAMPYSHGQQAATRYSASGAREEAVLGLPSVFEVALPVLQSTLMTGRGQQHARIDALFSLMAYISDTNVYHRGGKEGADVMKRCAQQFLMQGGSSHPNWKLHAMRCHRVFVRKRLSPGGAADLLAATCLIHEVTRR